MLSNTEIVFILSRGSLTVGVGDIDWRDVQSWRRCYRDQSEKCKYINLRSVELVS
jgi:hypothetical protein